MLETKNRTPVAENQTKDNEIPIWKKQTVGEAKILVTVWDFNTIAPSIVESGEKCNRVSEFNLEKIGKFYSSTNYQWKKILQCQSFILKEFSMDSNWNMNIHLLSYICVNSHLTSEEFPLKR